MLARHSLFVLLAAGLAVTACGSDDASDPAPADPVEAEVSADDEPEPAATDATDAADDDTAEESGEIQMFPDVVGATATLDGSTWTVAATLSSPYDSPERYADAWRVVGPDGTVYGERILTHDHANEQPFTRQESGIEIPEDVTVVTIEGRDQEFGYGGDTFELTLPR